MTRPYFTVCTFDRDANCWEDQTGFYSKADAKDEADAFRAHYRAKDVRIITTDGTLADLVRVRNALPLTR